MRKEKRKLDKREREKERERERANTVKVNFAIEYRVGTFSSEFSDRRNNKKGGGGGKHKRFNYSLGITLFPSK